jgi:hypothetical protein
VSAHNRRLKFITLDLEVDEDSISIECQVRRWRIANNTDDGEKMFTFCPDGEFREEADPDYAFEMSVLADWRSTGISRWMAAHDGDTASVILRSHPHLDGETVQWEFTAKVKEPSYGDDVRVTELHEVVWPIIGRPVPTYPLSSS